MSTESTVTTQVWTYLGAEWIRGENAISHVYKDEEGGERSFKRSLTPQSPGAVFTMTLTEEDTVYYKGRYAPVFVRMIDDAEERALLEVNHRSALGQARLFKQGKKDMSHSALKEVLDPLAVEYGRRNSAGRTAFLAAVIEVITGRR